MTNKIILVDFAGTLIKPEIIEQANQFRSRILQRSLPTKADHAHPEKLYQANREFVEQLTGLPSEAKIQYRENLLQQVILTGTQMHNQIATTLFQIGMYMAAKKHKTSIVPDGFVDQLKRIKNLGYKLAIVSGVREDIITGMLTIANLPDLFDYIYGQPPILGISNEENVNTLQKRGNILFVIGDKMSDLVAGKTADAQSIFVTWGHPSGGEEEFADYTINHSQELKTIIK